MEVNALGYYFLYYLGPIGRVLKWAGIVQTGQETYSLQDLSKNPSISWYDMILTVTAPDRIRLEDVVSQGEIGSAQVWARAAE